MRIPPLLALKFDRVQFGGHLKNLKNVVVLQQFDAVTVLPHLNPDERWIYCLTSVVFHIGLSSLGGELACAVILLSSCVSGVMP
jgi:hypothetical protein